MTFYFLKPEPSSVFLSRLSWFSVFSVVGALVVVVVGFFLACFRCFRFFAPLSEIRPGGIFYIWANNIIY